MSTSKPEVDQRPTQGTENVLDKNLTNMVEDTIARNVGTYGDVTLAPLKFGGHCFYVRRCMTGSMVDDDQPWRRALDGIELPEGYADRSKWATVVAKGPTVGRPCSKAHRKAHKRARCLADDVEIGDMVLCPSMGWEYDDIGIERSPLDPCEFYIEESKPLAIWRRTQS